jgi:hypothetical protein
MTGAAPADRQQGWPSQDSYLIGFHWDAPAEVFLGSLNITVEVLNGDVQRYLARTEIEGSLEPADAPELPLAGLAENGPEWRGGQFRGPLAAGETRWYRLDTERGETINAFATFPGDRFVGEGTEGEFSMVLSDRDGNRVGEPFHDRPQLSQAFGSDRHQATVSGTASMGSDPLPSSILIGFRWDGPPGQQSEIRFEAEAIFDPNWVAVEDGQEEEGDRNEVDTADVTSSSNESAATSESADSGDEDGGRGGSPAVFVVIGVAVIGVAGAVLFRRSRLRDRT